MLVYKDILSQKANFIQAMFFKMYVAYSDKTAGTKQFQKLLDFIYASDDCSGTHFGKAAHIPAWLPWLMDLIYVSEHLIMSCNDLHVSHQLVLF